MTNMFARVRGLLLAGLVVFFAGSFALRAEEDLQALRQKLADIAAKFMDAELADDKVDEIAGKIEAVVQEVSDEEQKKKYEAFVKRLAPVITTEMPLSRRIEIKIADPIRKTLSEVELRDDQLLQFGTRIQAIYQEYLGESAGKAPEDVEGGGGDEKKRGIASLNTPIEDEATGADADKVGTAGGSGGRVASIPGAGGTAKKGAGTGKKKGAPKAKPAPDSTVTVSKKADTKKTDTKKTDTKKK
ncbi:MAG: hypothetical protein AAB215_01765 [Planctomycetota bacterium]|mgnify:CR=1 FL=1